MDFISVVCKETDGLDLNEKSIFFFLDDIDDHLQPFVLIMH